MNLTRSMTIEVTASYVPSTPVDDALAALRRKLMTGDQWMYGWFISYPDRPIGSTVLCAACADYPGLVTKYLRRTRDHSYGYYKTAVWDEVEAIRPVDPQYDSEGWSPTREWTCLECHKKGWPRE